MAGAIQIRTFCVPASHASETTQMILLSGSVPPSGFAAHAHTLENVAGRFGQRFQRRSAVPGAVRPVLIVVGLVPAQDPPQMVLVPHEGAVQELAAASPDPAFGDRVHAGRPHVQSTVRIPASARTASNAAVKFDPLCLVAEVHDQIASLLAGPFPSGVQRDAEDADAPRRVLDHGQDVGLGAAGQVDAEEHEPQARDR
jgi:hypothetical protein